jgi:predicted DNA-binding ribbon-helix-helix protein
VIKNAYEFEKRAVKINKKDTSISMERIYWVILERLAKTERVSWRELTRRLFFDQPSEYKSRAGWLRAYVAGYAYVFLTRPQHMHNPPRQLMQWNRRESVFRYKPGSKGGWLDIEPR